MQKYVSVLVVAVAVVASACASGPTLPTPDAAPSLDGIAVPPPPPPSVDGEDSVEGGSLAVSGG